MLSTIRNYRELIYFLVHKELRVKYRNSFFGFFWTLLEPLGMMAIYTVVFSIIIRFKVDNYPLFILSGLIPWMFLSNDIQKGAKSLTVNASLIKKIYFPRQIFPLSTVLTNFIHFLPALALVLILALITEGGEIPFLRLLALPLIILLQALLVLSITIGVVRNERVLQRCGNNFDRCAQGLDVLVANYLSTVVCARTIH